MEMLKGLPQDVLKESLKWLKVAEFAEWTCFEDVRRAFPDADLVKRLLVFNIRRNRYRLIVYPVFTGKKLYIKALLNHQEYDRKDWVERWP